jgi:hypothetical protein
VRPIRVSKLRLPGNAPVVRQSGSRLDGAFLRVVGVLAVLVATLVFVSGAGGAHGDPPTITPTILGTMGTNDWYVSNVTVSWQVQSADPIRRESGCDTTTVTADTAGTKLTCSAETDCCTSSVSKTIKVDKTPPTITSLRTKSGNRRIVLRWAASADTRVVQIARSPGVKGVATTTLYKGMPRSYGDSRVRVGKRYRYTVTAFDEAGNTARKTRVIIAAGRLFNPAPGAHVPSAPLLRWTPVKGATYYNVQLMRRGTILSVWPASNHLQLRRSWVFGGKHYRLHNGTYRWYVWPGFGSLSANKYGRLLGVSFFRFSH